MPEVKASGHHGLPRSRTAQRVPAQECVWSVGVASRGGCHLHAQHSLFPVGRDCRSQGPGLPVASQQAAWKGQHLGASTPRPALELFNSHICFPKNVLPFPGLCGRACCMCVSVG